jgi:hypothetical protein
LDDANGKTPTNGPVLLSKSEWRSFGGRDEFKLANQEEFVTVKSPFASMLNRKNTQSTNCLLTASREIVTFPVSVSVQGKARLLGFSKSQTSRSAGISSEIPSRIPGASKQNSPKKARRDGLQSKEVEADSALVSTLARGDEGFLLNYMKGF